MTSASTSSSQQPGQEPGRPDVTGRQAVSGQQEATGPSLPTGAPSIQRHGRLAETTQPKIVVSQLALRQIEAHGASNLEVELGGVLLGYAQQVADQITVEVFATLPVVTDDHGPVHFTFTADSWAQIHLDKAKRYPDLQIVGWYHTHPDLGVFYSADDVIVHSAAFVMPWHVGLVLDPVRGEGCFFGWQPATGDDPNGRPDAAGELQLGPLDGFEELKDEQPSSVVSWQLVSSTIWRQGGYLPAVDEQSSQVYIPANDWPSLPPINPWWGVILGGLALVISLLLLLERILASLSAGS